jgi:hypothetical protein
MGADAWFADQIAPIAMNPARHIAARMMSLTAPVTGNAAKVVGPTTNPTVAYTPRKAANSRLPLPRRRLGRIENVVMIVHGLAGPVKSFVLFARHDLEGLWARR